MRTPQDHLYPIYRDCFSAAPWNERAGKTAQYPAWSARRAGYLGAYGFVAELAGVVVGAVYGWLTPAELPAENPFGIAVREAAPPEVAALLWLRRW